MFSTASVEKTSSTLVEPHSPGRSKFPIGLNQLGDESQQNNRIQSAVHRYNNSTVGSFARSINERTIPSPFRQAFLKNTQKYKNVESEKEEAHNGPKKPHNYYQGVGNFPIVHLKKSELITRPIKRMINNEFKIQLPELPFNRFLNNSPDVCLDTKTSTRSVLDVLQDLSRKRIHTKDDNEVTKRKCKGLGGDGPMDIEAPYKPLFVPKTKTSAVSLRDSTTQTQDLPLIELSPSKKNDKILNNKNDDPKAELRRKLARQNNEIFASLSSSTLTYPLKRNSGKILQEKDETKQNEQSTKRIRYFNEDKNCKKLQNGDASSKDLEASSNGDSNISKIEKRHKAIVDTKLSPNKDRLTTIFLEMQNVNPIVEVLTNNQSAKSTDSLQSAKTLIADEPIEKKSVSSENKHVDLEKSGNNSEGGSTTSISVTTTTFSNSYDTNKIPNFFNNVESGNKDVLVTEKNNSSSCVTTSNSLILTTTTVNFDMPSTTPAFKLPIASTVSSSVTHTPILSTGISAREDSVSSGSININKIAEPPKNDAIEGNDQDSTNQKSLFQPPTSVSGFTLSQGIGQQSAGAGLFKFGTGVNASPNPISSSDNKVSSENSKEGETNVSNVTNATSTSLTGFSSSIPSGQSLLTGNTAATTTATSSETQQNVQSFSFSDKSVDSNQNSEKPAFQFGFNPPATSSSMPSSLFNTGMPEAKAEEPEQKTESKEAPKPESSNGNTNASFPPNTFPNNPFSASIPTFGLSAVTSAQKTMPFKFGDKTETDKPNNGAPSSGTNFFDQKKPGLFTFGQKPEVSLSNPSSDPTPSQPNLFQQSTFSFGQKTSTPSSTPLQTSSNSNLFGQTTTSQANIFQQTSTTAANPVMNPSSPFGVNSQTSDSLNKPQVPSFIPSTSTTTGIMNNSFTQNKLSVPAFGQSTLTFGQSSTANFSGEKNVFGGNSTPAFGSTPGGQAGPFSSTFGDSNKQQNTSNPTSNFFSQPPTTQTSTFPSSTGFGTSAFSQTQSSENNIFGQKTGFEQNQNQATPFSTTQPFTSQTGFNFGATTTSASTGFTMSTPSTSAPVFAFGNVTKTTSTSAFGFTGTSQPESSSQSLFSFNNQSQPNTFKFGNATPKETPTFGSTGSGSSTFAFNSTPSTSEGTKPAGSVFNFGTPQTSSANTGFNFSATQSPVFSFGGSSSSSNTSKFNFGTTPTAGGIFTPGATPSPSAVPPLQGVFSIGSGSSQPRSRSSVARARRRP